MWSSVGHIPGIANLLSKLIMRPVAAWRYMAAISQRDPGRAIHRGKRADTC